MNQNLRDKMQDREIDLIDLMCDVLLHWRSIILCGLVGLILLGAYGTYKDYSSAKAAALPKEIQTTDSIISSIDEDRIKLLDLTAEQIIANNKVIEAQQYYLDNSFLVKNDVTEVHYRVLQYLISVDKTQKVDLNNLINSYTYALNSDELYGAVSDALGESIDEAFVYELITVSNSIIDATDSSNHSVVNVYSGEDAVTMNEEEDKNESYAAILTVTVKGSTDMMVGEMAKCVDNVINDNSQLFNENIAMHQIKLANTGNYKNYLLL